MDGEIDGNHKTPFLKSFHTNDITPLLFNLA